MRWSVANRRPIARPICTGKYNRTGGTPSSDNDEYRLRDAPSQPGSLMSHKRPGFTLIELLLVVAIIGTLIALLLPAVQAAREAARRSACVNNLKQLGVAVFDYEAAREVFPPGARWGRHAPPGKRKRHGSALVHLLPYLEQQALYEAFDFSKRSIDDAVFPGTTRMIGATPVPVFVCPSDEYDGFFDSIAVHNYAASNGPTEVYDNPNCSCDHPWQEYELAPIDDLDNYAGPFTRIGLQTSVSMISDGLSNTIFFGEVRTGCSVHTQAGWAKTNNGNGYSTTLIPINFDTCNPDAVDPCRRPCTWNTDVGYKSAHPGGAEFLYGDGSVHFLSESIDHQAYQYLGAKADGQVVQVD